MSLINGNGPFGPQRAGWASPPLPEGPIVYVEPHPRRIQAVIGDRVVLDTERALMVHRPGSALAYAFPADVVAELPHEDEPEAPGFVQVPWDAVDTWFEEGRRLVHYPPNPYHRVDCRPTTRRLRVEVAGSVVVDTDETIILFETSLAPRLYVHPRHVRTDLLHRTDTTSWCNYKGAATYWTVAVGEIVVEDLVWSYEEPLPESTPIAGHLCFDPDKAGGPVTIEAAVPVGNGVSCAC